MFSKQFLIPTAALKHGRIVIGPAPEEGRVLRFVGMAHEQCHIADSFKTEIIVDPRIDLRKSETLD
jgi:hypothetical protein